MPGGAWAPLHDRIAARLAAAVLHRLQADSPEPGDSARHDGLLRLLGSQFCEKYLPQYPPPPTAATSAGATPPEEVAWLSAAVWQCVDDLGLTRHADYASYKEAVARHFREGLRLQQPRPARGENGHGGASSLDAALSKAVTHLLLRRQSRPKRDGAPQQDTGLTKDALVGRLLPRELRRLVWTLSLQGDRVGGGGSAHAAAVRQALAHGAQTRAAADAGGRAGKTPISALAARVVSNVAARALDERPCPAQGKPVLVTDDEVVLALAELFYIYSGEYHPRHIPLMFPFVAALQPPPAAEDPPLPAAGAALSLLPLWVTFLASHAPAPLAAAACASRVMERLRTADASLYHHLAAATARRAFSSQDVLSRLVAAAPRSSGGGLADAAAAARALVQPEVFVRRWIGTGFVGILAPAAVGLVWDQCALLGWQGVLEEFALVVLLLLTGQIWRSHDFAAVQHTLCSCPAELYTANLAQAWLHLRRGADTADLAALNELEAADDAPGERSAVGGASPVGGASAPLDGREGGGHLGLTAAPRATAATAPGSPPAAGPLSRGTRHTATRQEATAAKSAATPRPALTPRAHVATAGPPRTATAALTAAGSGHWARGYAHGVARLEDLRVWVDSLSLDPFVVGPTAVVTVDVAVHLETHVLSHAERLLRFARDEATDSWVCVDGPARIAGLARGEAAPDNLHDADVHCTVFSDGAQVGLAVLGLYQPMHRRPRRIDWALALGKSHRCLAVPATGPEGGWNITESFGTIWVGAPEHHAAFCLDEAAQAAAVEARCDRPLRVPQHRPPLWLPENLSRVGRKGRELAEAAVACAVTVVGATNLPDNVLACRADVVVVDGATWQPLVAPAAEWSALESGCRTPHFDELSLIVPSSVLARPGALLIVEVSGVTIDDGSAP